MSARNTPAPCYCCEPCREEAVRAAAPDLLAALRAMVVWEDPDHPDHDEVAAGWHDRLVELGITPTSREVRKRLLDIAHAAIARAEGRYA